MGKRFGPIWSVRNVPNLGTKIPKARMYALDVVDRQTTDMTDAGRLIRIFVRNVSPPEIDRSRKMAEIRHTWLDEYFDERPQLKKPYENLLGYDIPFIWKCVVEKLLVERDEKGQTQK